MPVAGALPAAAPGGSEERLSLLFDAHHDRLYRLARRLTPNPDDALDLVQETFLKAAAAASSIPHAPGGQEAWLVRILVNIRRDQWRRTRVRRRHALQADGAPPATTGPEKALIARRLVWQALDALNPRRRAVLVMHEIEGLSVPEIASLLGIAAVTVRWHLSRGRRELARRLRSQGVVS